MRLLFIPFLFWTLNICAQDTLVLDEYVCENTIVYKLSELEAEKAYNDIAWEFTDKTESVVFDTIPTDSILSIELINGHYIFETVRGTNIEFKLKSFSDFDINILNNERDLQIEVYTLNGVNITDAEVRVNNKKIPFNKKRQIYLKKKSNYKGLLSVTYKGHTAYYNLNRNKNNPQAKRIYNKTLRAARTPFRYVLWNTPIRYVWKPIKKVIGFPKRTYYMISRGYFYFNAEKYINKFVKAYYYINTKNTDSKFISYPYHFNYHNNSSFCITNKPKYKLNDTVFFKTYITKKNGKPYKKDITIYIEGKDKYRNKAVQKQTISPTAPGSYEYTACLKPEYDFKLDKSYAIYSKKKRGLQMLSNTNFYLEEYNLSKSKWDIFPTKQNVIYAPDSATFTIKGTSPNGETINSGKVVCTIALDHATKYISSDCFIPTVILDSTIQIKPFETSLIITPNMLPNINGVYNIKFTIWDSQNEKQTITRKLEYYKDDKHIEINNNNNKIKVTLLKNNDTLKTNATIYHYTKRNQIIKTETISLPGTIKLAQYTHYLEITSNDISKTFYLAEIPPRVTSQIYFKGDSIKALISNPRELLIRYEVFENKKSILKGCSKSLDFSRKANWNKTYSILYQYVWAGESISESYNSYKKKHQINLIVSHPKKVAPGDTVTVTINAKNYKNKAVRKADITSWGLSSQFKDYSAPKPKEFYEKAINPEAYNSFKEEKFATKTLNLNIATKEKLINYNIKDEEYYKFHFPENKPYVAYIKLKDSTRREYAPYVLKKGIQENVYIITENYKPIFYDFASVGINYSFAPLENYKNSPHPLIKIRTINKEITLPYIDIPTGYKTIISIDLDSCKECKIVDLDYLLSNRELELINKYSFSVKPFNYESFTNVEIGNKLYHYSGTNTFFVGPVLKDVCSITDFKNSLNINLPVFSGDNIQALSNYAYIIKDKGKYPFITQHKNRTVGFLPINSTTTQQNITPYSLSITKQDIAKSWNQYKTEEAYRKNFFYNETNNYAHNLIIIDSLHSNKNKRIFRIIIRNEKTKTSVKYGPNQTSVFVTPNQTYSITLYFEDKTCWVSKPFDVKDNGIMYYTLPVLIESYSDFKSQDYNISDPILMKYEEVKNNYTKTSPLPSFIKPSYGGYKIKGSLYDSKGPIIGGAITVVGTRNGTYTYDGTWELYVDNLNAELEFSMIGYKTKTLNIANNSTFNIKLETDAVLLDAVQVVGYTTIKSEDLTSGQVSMTSKDFEDKPFTGVDLAIQGKAAGITINSNSGLIGEEMNILIGGLGSTGDTRPLLIIDGVPSGYEFNGDPSSIQDIIIVSDPNELVKYGENGSNGVVLISTLNANSINWDQLKNNPEKFRNQKTRKNFKDYSYWQPTLTTNKKGEAKFTIVMPDDINTWNNYYVLHSPKGNGYTTSKTITSKPLIAELVIPNFLLNSDSCQIKGISNNYGGSSLNITSKFYNNDSLLCSKNTQIEFEDIYTTNICPQNLDTLKIKYSTVTDFGYYDGEERKIPVYPVGTKKTVGDFHYIKNDTTLWIKSDILIGDMFLHISTSSLDILVDEIKNLMNYPHDCNEQKASKLLGYLLWKQYCNLKDEKFEYENSIKKLIKELSQNNITNGWAWWGKGDAVNWVTLHVIKVLKIAKNMGYKIDLDKQIYTPLENIYTDCDQYTKLDVLLCMTEFTKYKNLDRNYVDTIDSINWNTDYNKFKVIKLKQKYGISYSIDSVLNKVNETYTGEAYWGNNKYSLTNSETDITLLAYSILKADSLQSFDLEKIYRYFLIERKPNGYWMNTKESANILMTLFNDFANKEIDNKPTSVSCPLLSLKDHKKFPLTRSIQSIDSFKIDIKTTTPTYITSSVSYWDPKPSINSEYFSVSSNITKKELKQGEKFNLEVNINAKKDAKYCMIEIPIPAGCIYESKDKVYGEMHREYYNDKVYIYLSSISKGKHSFTIKLITKHEGLYTVNPSRIELMYFPIFYGHNGIEKITIKE